MGRSNDKVGIVARRARHRSDDGWRLQWVLTVTVVVGAAACGGDANTPAQPSGSNSSSTGSVTTPRQSLPATGSQVRNADQPITLTIQNSVVTIPGSTTYTFEVATDSAFATKVQTKSDVPEGATGQTSVKLDPLAASTEYYWRARATSAGTTGVFGATYRFSIGPAVVLNAPTLVSPAAGARTASRPTFTVTNAPRTGPAGPVSYRFEIATNPGFSPLLLDVTVPERAGGTTYRPAVELPAETTLYWRVTATDPANGVTSPASAAASFVTALAIDLSRVVYLNSPNVSAWPMTGSLDVVEQDGSGDGPMCMRFTDPGWPDSLWVFDPTDNFGVYGNQWYFAQIGGVWYGGAGEWLYRGAGTCKAGQGTRTIGPDSGFGSPFAEWVPRLGEMVGYMVTSVARRGPIRRTVDERTNVIVQPWCDSTLGTCQR